MIPPPPRSTLFPYTTLFRSHRTIDELKMNGVILLSNIGGKPLTFPEYRPFFEEANARKRSEEHTSELQSRFDLVCRLLLEKKKKIETVPTITPPNEFNHCTA